MTDDLEKRHKLLTGPDIVGQLGDDYFAALERQITDDVDPWPKVVLTGGAADGTTVRVVEGVTLSPARKAGRIKLGTDDLPVVRGFIWFALVGDIVLYPTYQAGATIVPCRILGGRVAMSTQSAQDALARARQAIDGPVTA